MMTPGKLATARMLVTQNRTVSEIAASLGVSRGTLYRHLAADGAAAGREDGGVVRKAKVVGGAGEGRFVVHFVPDRTRTVHLEQIRRLDPTGSG